VAVGTSGLAELRRSVLAISLLEDLDVVAGDTGAELAGEPPVLVDWDDCQQALGGAAPDSALARERLARLLWQRRWVADRPADDVAERVRPVGIPVRSDLHPGPEWVRERVLGGALDLGLGCVGLDPARPDVVIPLLPAASSTAQGSDGEWTQARDYLERMGALAAARYVRDPKPPMRPMGDCDVVTLLGSASLRAVLARSAAGMCPMAVPMRTRGWLDLSHIDPAFAVAAAAATDRSERGFDHPLLVTADEVTEAAPGGRPERIALRDRSTASTESRDVRYR
jgi:hypothetical protein